MGFGITKNAHVALSDVLTTIEELGEDCARHAASAWRILERHLEANHVFGPFQDSFSS